MSTLICLGLGYSAERFVAAFGGKFARIFATVRGKERAAILNAYSDGKLKVLVFDGKSATPELEQAIEGYRRFQELVKQYVQLRVEQTRAERQAGSKKRARSPNPPSPRGRNPTADCPI